MFGKSVIFGLVFLGFDFFIYFLVFLLSALILKSFPISESILFGAESVLWRVIYLQALFQLLLVSIVRYFELQNNFLLVLFIMIFAFAASSLIVFKDVSSFWRFFTFSNQTKEIGEGLVLVISTTVTWLLLFKVTGWSEKI